MAPNVCPKCEPARRLSSREPLPYGCEKCMYYPVCSRVTLALSLLLQISTNVNPRRQTIAMPTHCVQIQQARISAAAKEDTMEMARIAKVIIGAI